MHGLKSSAGDLITADSDIIEAQWIFTQIFIAFKRLLITSGLVNPEFLRSSSRSWGSL